MEQQKKMSAAVKWIAQGISFVFHPLFLGVAVAAYLLFAAPQLFAAMTEQQTMRLFIMITNNNLVFPLLVVLMLS